MRLYSSYGLLGDSAKHLSLLIKQFAEVCVDVWLFFIFNFFLLVLFIGTCDILKYDEVHCNLLEGILRVPKVIFTVCWVYVISIDSPVHLLKVEGVN
jgi:hypothetical protein